MQIPEWFVWLNGIVTPVLTIICGAALKELYGLRIALTQLSVRMEHLDGWETAVSQLQDRVAEMRASGSNYAINAVTKLEKSDEEQWKLLRKLERYVYDLRGRAGKTSDSEISVE